MSEDSAEQGHLAVVIEYHSYGAPIVSDTVQITCASIYLVEGVPAEDIYGLADMEHPDTNYLKIAHRIPIQHAEEIVELLISEFPRRGIPVQRGCIYDE